MYWKMRRRKEIGGRKMEDEKEENDVMKYDKKEEDVIEY